MHVTYLFVIAYGLNAGSALVCMRPANERRRYIVTTPLIGWAQTETEFWFGVCPCRSIDEVMAIMISGVFIIGKLNLVMPSFLFSCDQAALWMVQSVCLSVCLSVCDTVFTMFLSSYHHEIFRSYYHWQKWCPCKRSRSEVKGQGHRGHDPTSPFPDCNSSLN